MLLEGIYLYAACSKTLLDSRPKQALFPIATRFFNSKFQSATRRILINNLFLS